MGAEQYVNNGVFVVTIYGTEFSFSKVTGIKGGVSFETFVEGGGKMHMLPKEKTEAGSVVFEKGISVVDKELFDILTNGCEISDIYISLMKNGKSVESYYIASGLVTTWELGDLDAIHPGVAVKKFTIAHTGIKRTFE